MPGWENFFVAQVGASAALTGLVFVGVSINLVKILSFSTLTARVAEALIALIVVLILSSLLLIPDQSAAWAGLEVLGVAVSNWLIMTWRQFYQIRKTERQWRWRAIRFYALGQLSALLFIIAGAILLAGANGMYWIVAGCIVSYIYALIDAWVLLIEINR